MLCRNNYFLFYSLLNRNSPAALSTSKSVSMAHFLPGPGAYFSTAESIPDEHDDLNSASANRNCMINK